MPKPMALRSRIATIAVVLFGMAFTLPTSSAQIQFTDITDTSGLSKTPTFTSNFHGLGVTWFDFDNDTWPDMFVPNGIGQKEELYRNNGDGTFTLVNEYLPTLPDVELMGAIAADYDNDGDQDFYIFTDNEELTDPQPLDGPPNYLLKNLLMESGGHLIAPLFEEVAPAAGVDDLADPPLGPYPGHRSTIGAWLDADRDGFLDLYVGHWIVNEGPGLRGNADRFFWNRGDGTFRNSSGFIGLYGENSDPQKLRATLGFLAADLNGDLWPDFYVGHTSSADAELHKDMLWIANGDGTYRDATADSPGLGDDAFANMGVATADIDLDGDFDLYCSDKYTGGPDEQPAGNPLYLNNGDGTFSDNVADIAGVQARDSWAVVFFDLDHDGYEELFVGTTTAAEPDRNFLYRNRGDGTFEDITVQAGLQIEGSTRGAAYADIDKDGDLDFAMVDNKDHLRLFRNDTQNGGNNHVQVRLQGVWSNRDAVGATIRVHAGGTMYLRQFLGGTGAHSQNEHVAHVGIGTAATVDLIEVLWPSGLVTRKRDVAANSQIEITEHFAGGPTTFRVAHGSHVSGDVGELQESDDSYLQLVGKPGVDRIAVIFEAACPPEPYRMMELDVETGCSREGPSQVIQVYDFSRERYHTLDTSRGRRSDTTTELQIQLNPSRYVDGDTGRMKVRIAWSAGRDSEPLSTRVDRIEWKVHGR